MDGMSAVKPYDTLKAAVLEEFTPYIYQQMRSLANLSPLGVQKPSELLATPAISNPKAEETLILEIMLGYPAI